MFSGAYRGGERERLDCEVQAAAQREEVEDLTQHEALRRGGARFEDGGEELRAAGRRGDGRAVGAGGRARGRARCWRRERACSAHDPKNQDALRRRCVA